MTSLRHLYRLRIRSRPIFIALNIIYRNNKYMIQLLVSINVAYITITKPVINDRPRSLLYRPNSLSHRPRSLAESTKTGRDHSDRDPERPRSLATNLNIRHISLHWTNMLPTIHNNHHRKDIDKQKPRHVYTFEACMHQNHVNRVKTSFVCHLVDSGGGKSALLQNLIYMRLDND